MRWRWPLAALVTATGLVWAGWLVFTADAMRLPRIHQPVAAPRARRPPPVHLAYVLKAAALARGVPAGYLGVINKDTFAWTNVQLEVGASGNDRSFSCPAVSRVSPQAMMWFDLRACATDDGRTIGSDSWVTAVRFQADQGGAAMGIEPGMRLR
jgi:hypothetical protein